METSVDKCLAFCQSLAMSGQKFSFTLSIGKDNFSFSNKELGSSSCVKKKKKSPSQVRREQRRKEERSLKKAAETTEKVVEASESEESGSKVKNALFQCSQCDLYFKVEDDLNAHVGDLHTTLPTAEKERAPDQIADLLLTPIHGQRKDSGTLPSPPSSLSVVCDVHKPGPRSWLPGGPCGETFSSEDDFRVHVHEKHFHCDHPDHTLIMKYHSFPVG